MIQEKYNRLGSRLAEQHHNIGPLHIAADAAILISIAATTGLIVLGLVAVVLVVALVLA